jgi:hypothetical protein
MYGVFGLKLNMPVFWRRFYFLWESQYGTIAISEKLPWSRNMFPAYTALF